MRTWKQQERAAEHSHDLRAQANVKIFKQAICMLGGFAVFWFILAMPMCLTEESG